MHKKKKETHHLHEYFGH